VREAIENSLRRQTPGFLKTIGVVTSEQGLPREVLMQLQMQGQRVPPQPPPEFEQIKARLRLDYQVRDLKLASAVPTEVDTLLVLKPDGLSESEVYNLDQYLMRGGRVIIASSAFQPQLNANAGLSVTPLTSGLEDWLDHLGIEIEPTLVLDDRNQPLPVPEVQRTPLGMIQTWRMEPYPYLVEVRDEGLADRQVTSRLDSVGIYWGSPLSVESAHPDDLEVTEILKSSPRSWTDDDPTKVGYVDYQVPAEGLGPELLAVSLTGKFPSYFKDREPPGSGGDFAEEEVEQAPPTEVALEQSPDTRLVVIGDAAFVSDLVARALGLDSGFFASNLAFVQNLIDWINLDNDMLTIRSRGTGVRRLARVERGTEVTIEIVNYAIPILALLMWGAHRYWRRRHAVPLVATTTARRAQP